MFIYCCNFMLTPPVVDLIVRLGNEDTQKAPWGTVALVQTRQIHTHSHALLYRSLAPSARGGGSRGDRKQGMFVNMVNNDFGIYHWSQVYAAY
jgi:hypothetical protein